MSSTHLSTPSAKPAADEFVDHENQPSRQSLSAKKPRLSLGSPPQAASRKRVDPYTTLPPPSTSYMQLRVQLCGFKRVYRVVQLPLSYTFANLHTLLLFLFGWNGSHLHQSHVYSHVKMYSKNTKPGHMKKYGRVPPLPEWISPDDEREIYFWELQHPDSAIYEVVPQGSNRRSGGGYGFHYETRVEDQELTLGEVWNVKERQNASQGECTNLEMGIQYQYDLGASWLVHMTCESETPFYSVDPPSNVPILVRAQGAPPIEDAHHEVIGELDAQDKRISPLLYSETSFGLYCKGELDTRARKEELAVFNVQEELARFQERRKRREERKKVREAQLEQGDEDEDDDEEEYDEEDREYDY